MFISVSAIDTSRFYWMRCVDGRKVRAIDGTVYKVEPKMIFGVREIKGKDYDEVLLSDGTKFKLAIQRSENLMNVSKEYKGKHPSFDDKKLKPQTKKPAAKTVDKKNVTVVKKQIINKPVKPVLPKAKPITVANKISPKAIKLPMKPQVHTDNRKATTTKIVQKPVSVKPGNKNIKLSQIDMPELEDFTDTSIPHEFQRYARVESTGVLVQKIKVGFKDEKETQTNA